jgi:hypothetical protein
MEIPPGPFFYGDRRNVKEGGGLGNRCANVNRVARSRVRSLALFVGGTFFSRVVVPLRLPFRGDVDQAKPAARGIRVQLLLAPMVLHSDAIARVWERLYRSTGLDLRRLSGDVVPGPLLQGCGMCCRICG